MTKEFETLVEAGPWWVDSDGEFYALNFGGLTIHLDESEWQDFLEFAEAAAAGHFAP